MMVRGLVSMHKLVIRGNRWFSSTVLESLRAMHCITKLLWGKGAAGQLCHRVIICHADLTIVLVILSNDYLKMCETYWEPTF